MARLVWRQAARRDDQLGPVRRPEVCRLRECRGRRSGRQGPGREEDHLAPARLGREPSALLGHADPDHPLPGARPRAGARKRPAGGAAAGLHSRWLGQPAAQARRLPCRCDLPGVWPAGAPRNRHHGHLCGLVLVLHALLRSEEQRGHGGRWRQLLDADGPVHRWHRARHPHLLYARFWTKVMRDLGLVKVDEPFTKLLTQGMVLNHIYSRKGENGAKDYFWPNDVENVSDETGKVVAAKLKIAVGNLPAGTLVDYEGIGTMSKSKNNGVDPQDLIEKYGADTARLYTMFTAPPEATLEWNDAAVEGSYRFLRRVWNFGVKLTAIDFAAAIEVAAKVTGLKDIEFGKPAKALRLEIHSVLKQVDYDYQRMQYNTVVSGAMKMINALEGFTPTQSAGAQVALIEGFGILLRCLYPATPHITHCLWSGLGYAGTLGDLLDAPWPQVDESALLQDEIELMLQINGKLRGAIVVSAGASKVEIELAAIDSEVFRKLASGATPKKVIVVPGRLVNLVV